MTLSVLWGVCHPIAFRLATPLIVLGPGVSMVLVMPLVRSCRKVLFVILDLTVAGALSVMGDLVIFYLDIIFYIRYIFVFALYSISLQPGKKC